MNFLMAIINGLVEFVRRNPLTCLVILILAVGAPALLKGIAVFILYFILGLVVLLFVLSLLFRWRITKMRRQMEGQFGQDGFGNTFSGQKAASKEGDVKLYKTSDAPEKMVSENIGDYVEFEETKEDK